VKRGADIEPALNKIRSHAQTYPGFVGAENLRNAKDSTVVAMIQTWDKLDDWMSWESSSIRQSILDEAKPLLIDEPRVTVYRVMATHGWGSVGRGS
jgi:antibiotic biosynthesis monooxygenase (ABM) superfamily enzyme